MACAKSFARWSALRTACAVQEWRAGAVDFAHSSLDLPLAPLQHTSAAPHAAGRFFSKRSGGQAVRGSEAVQSAVRVWLCCGFVWRRRPGISPGGVRSALFC